MGDWSEQLGSWSREPQAWIVGAAVLFGVAVVLLLLAAVAAFRARRRARQARRVLPDDRSRRLLAALVTDPDAALAALARDDEPCATAIALLQAGVAAPAVARVTGIDVAELGDVVATRLGVLEPS
ncbi:hypothetical protein [Actinomycetospora corticicola]|uniref:Uncharacterized protein n=1 Tax=Actinomycetospora corticicola TaxID=663602 RepID=A0A7Y9DYW7_9PSEU|nr:hypothetical protein [Actinomycetospora corticicola]NYD38073.1 hypothetical protein [Actinomycetospora corticicola]